ncbi:ATP-binding protein [Kitasatospora viridis]|uniref:Anti-sigma regulatory factor (Ser/Thr protein kinase) n=1 Tax=Kitasatospora viridis TaxID=281105 RepID=A0A561UBN6_9ACTN|nr:ATP-binding protein [Kitasatospora viridis]TWF96772.1 anti-sigma regulatory factor (Ser/Thr protein kinase) [Kitasatospora viridis]
MERDYRPLRDEFHLTANGDAVRRARERVVGLARDWGTPLSEDTLDDLRLCVSELVANALEHAGGECRVSVVWGDETLLVEVADRSQRPPVMLSAGDELPSGRGLVLVDALAGGWGWRPLPGGKVVYFAFPVGAVPTGRRGGPVAVGQRR